KAGSASSTSSPRSCTCARRSTSAARATSARSCRCCRERAVGSAARCRRRESARMTTGAHAGPIAAAHAAAGLLCCVGALVPMGYLGLVRCASPWIGMAAARVAAFVVGARWAHWCARTDRVGAVVRGAVLAQLVSLIGLTAGMLGAVVELWLLGRAVPRVLDWLWM